MEQSSNHSATNAEAVTEIANQADNTGRQVATMAVIKMDDAFADELSTQVQLWSDHHCGPEQYDEYGQLMGRVFNAGRRIAALELLGYSVVIFGCASAALWITSAAAWLYCLSFGGSIVFSLCLSLSGKRR